MIFDLLSTEFNTNNQRVLKINHGIFLFPSINIDCLRVSLDCMAIRSKMIKIVKS